MDLSKETLVRGRYRREDGKVVIEVALTEGRQIFNARDPAPFRERDLDSNFVTYVASSAQEFPLSTPMKLQIYISDESSDLLKSHLIRDAIHGYFNYEARLAQAEIRKRFKNSRWLVLVGLTCLFGCLSLAEFMGSLAPETRVLSIFQEGLVIVGWVAMWRPAEVILYDWWPINEERRYYEKLAKMEVEVKTK